MRKAKVPRLSLAQHFAAPDEFTGEFGWLCGYSADSAFIAMAAERFTRQIAARRAASGCIRLGLLLDKGNPQLSIAEVPGVMHFPVADGALPFLLLHAKVAVLGFRHVDDATRWRLRLLVSTGNWTRGTLEDNIDLAWRVDIDSNVLDEADAATVGDCADLAAAWGMLTWLRDMFDTSILDAVPAGRSDTESMLAVQNLAQWVAQASARAKGTARFIDNRGQSLLAHVQRRAKNGNHVARNYLAMGSAYYEGATDEQVPAALRSVVDGLRENLLLTQTADVNIFVNPEACQAVAAAAAAIAESGWKIRPPVSAGAQLFMHAKFIFSANRRESSNHCSSPWLYLGSGNLTGPGFIRKMSPSAGNLEAGVVLVPNPVFWDEEEGVNPSQVISNLLPIHRCQEVTEHGNLHQGESMESREAQFVAPPLTFLMWQPNGAEAGWLAVPAGGGSGFDVLDSSGACCPRDAAARIRWQAARPVQVTLRWSVNGELRHAAVPVVDEFGRVAAAPLRDLDLEEAGWELDGFPSRGGDDPSEPGGCGGELPLLEPDAGTDAVRKQPAQYPVRAVMQLLEQVADRQCDIDRLEWSSWCHRLEQVLSRAGGSAAVKAFCLLGINPLSALYAPAFRPAFAESSGSDEGIRYEGALRRIELAWNVTGLAPMGESQ